MNAFAPNPFSLLSIYSVTCDSCFFFYGIVSEMVGFRIISFALDLDKNNHHRLALTFCLSLSISAFLFLL